MNVSIKAIRDPGTPNKERLVMQVLKDDDIGYYVVFATTQIGGGQVSNIVRHTFWFPDKKINSGDLVVLYTKQGDQSENINKDGSTTHFFYWGLLAPIWNEKDSCAVFLEARNWIAKRPFEQL